MMDKKELEQLSSYLAGMIEGVLGLEEGNIRFTLVLSYPSVDMKLKNVLINNFKDSKLSMEVLDKLVKQYKEGKCNEEKVKDDSL